MRAFHADFVARRADTATTKLNRVEKNMKPEERLSETPQVIHLALWGFPIQQLDNWILQTEANIKKGIDIHHLNDRLLALARSYTVEEAKEGLRMVFGELSFFDQTVQVLAKVKEGPTGEGAKRFMVQTCVTKLKKESSPHKLPPTTKEILKQQADAR
ncbi:hypothetical protein NMY22_g11867 [Coprinellus aureogranulatus]|nr:hypothetical protein NMY22_g11867 [Coprinellus aureogranulatus]